ncbi:MAG: transposase [Candidatus Accumulibacter sp.]|nr:transposase [Accumulibacter sp.]
MGGIYDKLSAKLLEQRDEPVLAWALVGIDQSRESAPDATTRRQFRHLLEKHELTKQVFEAINGQRSAAGLMMREGTIADATLIAAAPSVKNEAKARDPEMHQTKKGNPWYFGMEAHLGVDAESGLYSR